MDKLILGTHHIALKPCGEEAFQKAVHFYRDVLGLSTIRTWGDSTNRGIMLDTGSSIIEITSNGTTAMCGLGSIVHLALTTKDVDGAIRTVRDAGYEIIMEPKDVTIRSNPPLPIRIGFCRGPVGEEVEFFCEK